MKKRIYLLPLIFFIQESFASPQKDAANDKSLCFLNQSTIELQTTKVSENNPEYWKEAELMPGLKAKFSQVYRYYGMRTFIFDLVMGKKVIARAETTLEGENPFFAYSHPTLTLISDVTLENQTYTVRCDFMIDGNK